MKILEVVTSHLLANVTTAIFVAIIYANFVLWREYLSVLLWAFIISQALHSPKAMVMRAITAVSDESDGRPMVLVALGLIIKPFQRMYAEGRPVYEMVFMSALNWCIELFALVGLASITSRYSVCLWVGSGLATAVLVLHAVDRRVFAYRRVVSDNTLACIMVISTFFASVSFIVVFLGLESVLEGFSAGQGVSMWVQAKAEGEDSETEWGKNIARISEFAQDSASSLASQYNETAWFPVVHDAFSQYMEHGTFVASPETCANDSCGAAESGFPGNFPDLVDKARDALVGLNISMEHVVNYGGPSGKILANGASLLASLASLIIMVGFKVVLFFTCVFYILLREDFLERNIGDFLPISSVDRKRAMTTLRRALQGVFFLPCKVACLHGVVTLFSFRFLQIEFPFFAAFMAVVVSVLPIVPAYIVCWPWALALVLHGRWIVGILLAVSQHGVLSAIDTELCTQGVREANPYLTSLSSFLGFSVFGGQGVLLGPLIICLATLLYGFLGTSVAQFPQEGTRESPDPVCETEGGARQRKLGSSHRPGGTCDAAGLCKGGRTVANSSDSCGSLDAQSGRRRVTLRMARHTLGGGDGSTEQADTDESNHQTWRLIFSPSVSWEAFLREVQDVTGVSDVSGVFGSDCARIRRADFIEDGETLDIKIRLG